VTTTPQTPESSAQTSALVARLGDVAQFDLEVVEVSAVSATMRRIRCTAPGLADLSYLPGQDLMLTVPAAGDAFFRRRYTIRAFDPTVPAVDIDVVLHGDGPAAAWAAAAQPGSRIEAIGPRGKVTVDATADWHLFAGDDSAIPASLGMAESLSDPDRAIVVLEVDGVDDRQEAFAPDGRPIPVQWLYRAGADPSSGALLVDALRTVDLPAGRGHAYLAGEIGPADISAKPYWRVGRANAPHGEPERP
jgi:NADPH-dependent ferric siderophore reductase